MALLAVYAARDGVPDAMAIRVHGFYSTITEAQAASRALASEQVDVDAYVIDHCGRWMRVRPPADRNAAQESEEISAPENMDPGSGRMGSVCDVRRSALPNVSVEGPQGPAPSGVSMKTPTERAAEKKEAENQRTQLDGLLRAPVPSTATDDETYATQREAYATLRAFEKRLTTLYREGLEKCQTSSKEIASLDERHPEYTTKYHDNYVRALQGSGMRPDDVPFMRYLRDGN